MRATTSNVFVGSGCDIATWRDAIHCRLPRVGDHRAADVDNTTGDAQFNTVWSLSGLPTVGVPAALGDDGLPLSLQLGAHVESFGLFQAAAWVSVRSTSTVCSDIMIKINGERLWTICARSDRLARTVTALSAQH